MFGTSSFAQTPFASLTGTNFALSILENITVADTNAAVVALLFSIAENAGFNDSSNQQLVYPLSVIENISIADTFVGGLALSNSITEGITLANPIEINGAFSASISENITVDDVTKVKV